MILCNVHVEICKNIVTDLLKALSYGAGRPIARQRLRKHVPTNTQKQKQCSLWIRAVLVVMKHAMNICPLKWA
jgi:hypothetical protein